MTHDEEDDVDSNGEHPVEDGHDEGKDGGEEKKTHGVSVLLSGVVEGVLSSMSVDLLGDETEEGDRDTEHQEPDDELLLALLHEDERGRLTYPSIRPNLKSLENSKCRLTFGSRAAGFAGALGAIIDEWDQRCELSDE